MSLDVSLNRKADELVVSADNIISRIIPYMMRILRIIWEKWQMPPEYMGLYGDRRKTA